ncbi:MAG: hypothetical protein K0S07_1757 [Chlamydiales bacterium]|nr:hypothetical protein [Chlamydiales bacterium]
MNRQKAEEFEREGLRIAVTGRNVHVTDAMKDYAVEKLMKIERYNLKPMEAHVVMDIERIHHRVDIDIKVNHTRIKAQAVSEDMYVSIDRALAKIESQLLKYKGRLQDHHAKGLSATEMEVHVLEHPSDEVEEINDAIEDESVRRRTAKQNPKLVAQETRPLKTLSHSDAMIKLVLSQDLFLVFKNEESGKLEVIYRRNDGDFGVIKPE